MVHVFSPLPLGEGSGVRASLRIGALSRAMTAPQRAWRQCECKALTPTPLPMGEGLQASLSQLNAACAAAKRAMGTR